MDAAVKQPVITHWHHLLDFKSNNEISCVSVLAVHSIEVRFVFLLHQWTRYVLSQLLACLVLFCCFSCLGYVMEPIWNTLWILCGNCQTVWIRGACSRWAQLGRANL